MRKFEWSNGSIHFLQPDLDQSIAIAKLLRKSGHRGPLIAVFLRNERIRICGLKRIYSFFKVIDNYESILDNALLVPGGALSTQWLLQYQDICLGKVCMSRRALLVFDKLRFLQFCQSHGFPVPKTWENLSDIPVNEFPIFYKQKQEKGGGIRGIAFKVNDIPHWAVSDLIFQEYIDSRGTYGVGFLASEGRMLTVHVHYEVESLPREGGSAVIIESVTSPDKRLLSLVENLVMALKYSGWGLAELKYDPKRQDYVFMEINAKFWASCELAFRNEPNFLKFLFGVENEKEYIDRALFLNRALARGPLFVVRHLPEFRKSEIICYPGLTKSLLYGIGKSILKGHFC